MADRDVLVVVGQSVVAGQQIARVGDDGDSTACHLHFEVLVDGRPTDPLLFLGARGASPG
jgi:murein DD-endopeptidase MepM/ murein hydrolase activator NlpD